MALVNLPITITNYAITNYAINNFSITNYDCYLAISIVIALAILIAERGCKLTFRSALQLSRAARLASCLSPAKLCRMCSIGYSCYARALLLLNPGWLNAQC
jgi:hypothetical protein